MAANYGGDVSEFDDFILRRALDESPDGILICDSQGLIRYTNNALLGITGFSESELIEIGRAHV